MLKWGMPDMLNLVHPVGELYLTTNANFNPNTAWGGTWEQLTADAYFKIVTSKAGSLGGTASNHKIPLTSIPSHAHTNNTTNITDTGHTDGYIMTGSYTRKATNIATNTAGGGQAYYPYYYGVIAWHRTA